MLSTTDIDIVITRKKIIIITLANYNCIQYSINSYLIL